MGIIEILGGATIAGGVIVFLGKEAINKFFDAALKTYENKLDLLKIEHQIKFSKMHDERASIVKELYKELYVLEGKLGHLTTAFQGPEWTKDDKRNKDAFNQLIKCNTLLEINRIFFSEEFCNQLSENIKACKGVINGMEIAKTRGKLEASDAEYGKPHSYKPGNSPLELWFIEEKKVNIEIRNNRIELAKKFREIIGVLN